jgi:hypothetical protein
MKILPLPAQIDGVSPKTDCHVRYHVTPAQGTTTLTPLGCAAHGTFSKVCSRFA